MLRDFVSDLRYSLRALRRSPVFSLTAVVALALGIGANTAIFSVVNAVLLKRLPYPDSDRIVVFMTRTPAGSVAGASATRLNLWKARGGAFRDVSGYRFRLSSVSDGARTVQVSVGEISTDFFRLFGASFERGRAFTADEQRPGGGHVAVLSEGFARRHLGNLKDVLGQTIRLDRDAYVIVGVLDPGFDGEPLAGPAVGNPGVWIPLQVDPGSGDQTNSLMVAARLVAGTTVEGGRSQLESATQRFRQMFPGIIGPKDTFSVEGLQDSMVQDARRSLLVLQGAVGFVLLIACANVAGLLLVRSSARAREIAVKAALGAGRSRIVRQLLTESLVLSTVGGTLGLTLGVAGMQALLALYPGNLAWVGGAGVGALDTDVLGFSVLVTVITAVLAGLVPALHASGFDLNLALKESTAGSGSGGRWRGARSLLVGVEIALALVLLVGAALLARTFLALRAVDAGFDPRGVVTLRTSLGDPGLARTAGVEQLVRHAVQRLSEVPGVAVASASCCMPLENDMRLRFIVVGRPLEGAYHGMGSWRSVSSAYFDALKIPLVRGRLFTEQDRLGAAGVVIINQTMARQLWPDGDPLNDTLLIGKGLGPRFAAEPARRIVGIVGDVRDAALAVPPRPTTYVPIAQLPDGVMEQTMGPLPLTWIVKTSGESQALSRTIQEELERVSSLPVARVESMSEIVRGTTSDCDFYLTIMSVLGAAALMLAVVGLNGIVSYSVQQRTKEIGVRIALGAEAAHVRNMIVSEGMRLTVAAVTIGIAGALSLTRFMTRFLFGVAERDPLVFVGVPAIVIAAALVAVYLPARAISRIDTIRALRSE